MIPFWVAIIGFAVGFWLGVAIISCFAWRNYNRGYKDGRINAPHYIFIPHSKKAIGITFNNSDGEIWVNTSACGILGTAYQLSKKRQDKLIDCMWHQGSSFKSILQTPYEENHETP